MTNENSGDANNVNDNVDDDDDDDLLQNFRSFLLDNDPRLHLSNDFFNQNQSPIRSFCGKVLQSSDIASSMKITLDIRMLRSNHRWKVAIASLAPPICGKCEYVANRIIRANSEKRIRPRRPRGR